MSELHTALSVDVEEDLLPLSALLHQRGVAHRVFEEGGRQVLKVQRRDQAEQVEALYQAWRGGKVQIEIAGKAPRVRVHSAVPWRHAPVTLTLIGLSICGFLLVYLQAPLDWLSQFTFLPFHVDGKKPVFDSMQGQYWRLVTPAFLHFGWLHIVFNSLWMWELGTRVEKVMGHLNMFLLFLVIAVASNTCQYLFGGPGLFGGMSGVVYGLLGFAWVAPLLQPAWRIQPAKSIMIFMVGWLVVCMLGLVEVMGFGAIANAAHLGGLITGALCGAAFGLLSRMTGHESPG
jgi:GlpG protein